MNETICDVRWEGPYAWEERSDAAKSHHVLYAIFCTHHLYGQNALLYIGMTADMPDRLAGHGGWIRGEYDKATFKVASVGVFPSIKAWWKAWNPDKPYGPADAKLVKAIESLLIYTHQPAYNTQGKNEVDTSAGALRVFNTGRCGQLHPEISTAYYEE